MDSSLGAFCWGGGGWASVREAAPIFLSALEPNRLPGIFGSPVLQGKGRDEPGLTCPAGSFPLAVLVSVLRSLLLAAAVWVLEGRSASVQGDFPCLPHIPHFLVTLARAAGDDCWFGEAPLSVAPTPKISEKNMSNESKP